MDNTETKTLPRYPGEGQVKKTIIAIITARGGSKGLPRKNIRLLDGKPLIAHSILAATRCPHISRCVVTTEDPEIKEVSLQWGAEVIDRPQHLATDTALSRDVVAHVLEELRGRGEFPDYFALLQPTSPLRTEKHLSECIELFLSSDKASAVSVTEAEHHPYKFFKVTDGGEFEPMVDYETLEAPRQLLPKIYRQNGAIYVLASDAFLSGTSFCIPPILPYYMNHETSIDIDNAFDLSVAEMIIKQQVKSRGDI